MTVLASLMRGVDATLSRLPAVWVGDEAMDAFQRTLLRLRALRGGARFSVGTPVAARLAFRRDTVSLRQGFPVAGTVEVEIPLETHVLSARWYQAVAGAPAPGLMVYFHGGGFVIGDLETHDDACRLLCQMTGLHVLAVDYRLAPEHPFPAAHDDAFLATRWAYEQAGRFGVTPETVCVGGDSAGGNLAIHAGLEMARQGFPLAAQWLLYPGTDLDSTFASKTAYGQGYFLDKEDRDWFYGLLLSGAEAADGRVSPLGLKDLHLSPPTVMRTAELDMLRDEGEAFVTRLRQSGVRADFSRSLGLGHGYMSLASIHAASRQAVEAAAMALRDLLRI